MENATTFGAQASTYANYRPGYPDALFDWIASQAPKLDCVWDVGTGSGQAALALAERFSKVHATDLDPSQINSAKPHPKIDYTAAPAHLSGLDDNSVSAITVATALHWFDHGKFWKEIARTARPGAVFCAWTYHRTQTDDEVRVHLIEPVLDVLEPYWSDGNRLSWRGYTKEELAMPFTVLEMPELSCELNWSPAQLAGLLRTWSAHKRARDDGHEKKLREIEINALEKLGEGKRHITLPLNTLAARID